MTGIHVVGSYYSIEIECPECWGRVTVEGEGDPPAVLRFACPWCSTVIEVE